MKKIALIGNTVSSVLNFRRHFIELLVAKKYEVYCFAIDYTADSFQKVKILGAEPVSYKLQRGGMNPLSDIFCTLKLAHQLRVLKPDIVFSTFVKPVIFATIAARLAGVKTVISMLEGLGYFFTEQPDVLPLKTKLIKKIQILLYKIPLPKSDALIFLNHDDPRDLLFAHSIKVKKYIVVNGVGLKVSEFKFSSPPKERISFLFIGRILKEKGIREFLEAARIVKQNYNCADFVVVGGFDDVNPGCLDPKILEEYTKTDVIHYTGHVSSVVRWINSSSVFVLPSYREGLPRSIQEAMIVGRAIITTNVAGCKETVIDNHNGFLIEKWSVTDLVKKMLFFIENPSKIAEMGHNSHELALKKFDVDVINRKLLSIIETS